MTHREDGHTVTNNHLVEAADTIDVASADGSAGKGEVVGGDPRTDIARITSIHPPRRPPEPPAGVAPLRGGTEAPGRPRCSPIRTLVAFAVVLALAIGCGTGGERSAKEAEGSEGGGPREVTNVRETGGEEAGTGGFEDSFVTSGESGGEAGAANRIEGVRFQIFDGYERLLIDFGGGGGAAGIPRWTIESPEEGGYVRIRFPGVGSTRVSHEDFVGSALDEIFVVRDRGGGLFADVFAMHGFRYRVTELPESGQLAVDFRGVLDEIRFPPTTGDRAVVLQPREAEEIQSPVDVRGYVRLFEGQVTVSLIDREREVLASKTVRANDWASAWGLFRARLAFSGYEGFATLRVGSRSPKDGSFVGTETEVFLQGPGPGRGPGEREEPSIYRLPLAFRGTSARGQRLLRSRR